MDNLHSPAYPQTNDTMQKGEQWDENRGFTKLEYAALMIAQGMCSAGDWLQEASPAQYKLIAEVAIGIGKSVLEEANK